MLNLKKKNSKSRLTSEDCESKIVQKTPYIAVKILILYYKINRLITFREIFIVNFASVTRIISKGCEKIQILRMLE